MRKFAIIYSSDLLNDLQTLKIINEIKEHIDGIKLGLPIMIQYGEGIIKKIKEITNKPLIADFKVADIGFHRNNQWSGSNAKIIEKAYEIGFEYITFHPIVGISSTIECVTKAHEIGMKVLAIPNMTGVGSELIYNQPINRDHIKDIMLENNLNSKIIEDCITTTELILNICEELKVDGYIGPANKLDIIKKYREITDRPIFSPGIGRQNNNKEILDQINELKLVCGDNCAMIIGSTIYSSTNPIRTIKNIVEIRNKVMSE